MVEPDQGLAAGSQARMKQVMICVDPGVEGGVATILGSTIVSAARMPETQEEVVALLRAESSRGKNPKMLIERVSGFIGEAHPGSRMFTFGESFGLLKGAALALGWPLEAVCPLVWQNALRLGTNRTLTGARAAWKNVLKAKALELYPSLTPTLKTADAILIAHFLLLEQQKPKYLKKFLALRG